MKPRVVWKKGVPGTIRKTVAPILSDYLFVVPAWCQLLTVNYQHDLEGQQAIASMETDPEYRQAKLTVYAHWHTAEADFRILTIIHELVHIALSPMAVFTQELVKAAKDSGYADVLADQWRRAEEGATEDLSRAIRSAHG